LQNGDQAYLTQEDRSFDFLDGIQTAVQHTRRRRAGDARGAAASVFVQMIRAIQRSSSESGDAVSSSSLFKAMVPMTRPPVSTCEGEGLPRRNSPKPDNTDLL
jgi:hypothetical protein